MIKKQTTLPPGTVITRCPPTDAAATPLRILRAESERRAAETGDHRVPISDESRRRDEYLASENAAERYVEAFHDARHGGMSISDALDEANYARSRQ